MWGGRHRSGRSEATGKGDRMQKIRLKMILVWNTPGELLPAILEILSFPTVAVAL